MGDSRERVKSIPCEKTLVDGLMACENRQARQIDGLTVIRRVRASLQIAERSLVIAVAS